MIPTYLLGMSLFVSFSDGVTNGGIVSIGAGIGRVGCQLWSVQPVPFLP